MTYELMPLFFVVAKCTVRGGLMSKRYVVVWWLPGIVYLQTPLGASATVEFSFIQIVAVGVIIRINRKTNEIRWRDNI